MVTKQVERYVIQKSVQAVVSGASDFTGATTADQQKRDKWGSANSLIITSLASENIAVDLDGHSTKRLALLVGLGASFVLDPKDGVFFDSVKLTNLSGTDTANDEINVRMSRVDFIEQ